jgi:hypothetical protein
MNLPSKNSDGDLVDLIDELRLKQPSMFYVPGRTHDLDGEPIKERDNGQLQFHKAPHIFRLLVPGNGFGKTTCAAVEADWWLQHTHPYLPIPERAVQVIWVAMKYQQFEMKRAAFERDYLTGGFSWNSTLHRYRWPRGDEMYVVSDDVDWQSIQGVEPDLIVIDEECNSGMWAEMQARRRGKTETKYVISATATEGFRWMYYDLYVPWKKWHKAHGMNETEATYKQRHVFEGLEGVPGIWCWPRGSHRDNPTATQQTWAYLLSRTWGSVAERHVRLNGGFRDFAGSPVFDHENLEILRQYLVDDAPAGVIVPDEKVA